MSDPAPFDFYGGMRPATLRLIDAVERVDEADRGSRSSLRRRLELGVSELAAMQFLLNVERSRKPIRLSDLCRWLDLTPGAGTALCNRLEEAGIVDRVADETDRRSRLVVLTERGRRTLQNALDEQRRRLRPILDDLDDEATDAIAALLERVALAITAR